MPVLAPRRRPRVRSTSWRTLWWLVRREAYLRTQFGAIAERAPSPRRVHVLGIPARHLTRRWLQVVRDHPEWRFYQ